MKMTKGILTNREVKNKVTGVDIYVSDYQEVPHRIKDEYLYHVIVVSNLFYYKTREHRESDVVQFMVSKTFGEFEDLYWRLYKRFPSVHFPELPAKSLISANASVNLQCMDKVLKKVSCTQKLASSPMVISFLRGDKISREKDDDEEDQVLEVNNISMGKEISEPSVKVDDDFNDVDLFESIVQEVEEEIINIEHIDGVSSGVSLFDEESTEPDGDLFTSGDTKTSIYTKEYSQVDLDVLSDDADQLLHLSKTSQTISVKVHKPQPMKQRITSKPSASIFREESTQIEDIFKKTKHKSFMRDHKHDTIDDIFCPKKTNIFDVDDDDELFRPAKLKVDAMSVQGIVDEQEDEQLAGDGNIPIVMKKDESVALTNQIDELILTEQVDKCVTNDHVDISSSALQMKQDTNLFSADQIHSLLPVEHIDSFLVTQQEDIPQLTRSGDSLVPTYQEESSQLAHANDFLIPSADNDDCLVPNADIDSVDPTEQENIPELTEMYSSLIASGNSSIPTQEEVVMETDDSLIPSSHIDMVPTQQEEEISVLMHEDDLIPTADIDSSIPVHQEDMSVLSSISAHHEDMSVLSSVDYSPFPSSHIDAVVPTQQEEEISVLTHEDHLIQIADIDSSISAHHEDMSVLSSVDNSSFPSSHIDSVFPTQEEEIYSILPTTHFESFVQLKHEHSSFETENDYSSLLNDGSDVSVVEEKMIPLHPDDMILTQTESTPTPGGGVDCSINMEEGNISLCSDGILR